MFPGGIERKPLPIWLKDILCIFGLLCIYFITSYKLEITVLLVLNVGNQSKNIFNHKQLKNNLRNKPVVRTSHPNVSLNSTVEIILESLHKKRQENFDINCCMLLWINND